MAALGSVNKFQLYSDAKKVFQTAVSAASADRGSALNAYNSAKHALTEYYHDQNGKTPHARDLGYAEFYKREVTFLKGYQHQFEPQIIEVDNLPTPEELPPPPPYEAPPVARVVNKGRQVIARLGGKTFGMPNRVAVPNQVASVMPANPVAVRQEPVEEKEVLYPQLPPAAPVIADEWANPEQEKQAVKQSSALPMHISPLNQANPYKGKMKFLLPADFMKMESKIKKATPETVDNLVHSLKQIWDEMPQRDKDLYHPALSEARARAAALKAAPPVNVVWQPQFGFQQMMPSQQQTAYGYYQQQ